jgi:transposase
VRTHVGTHCGLILDRDLNAARNTLWRGQRLRGVAGMPALAGVAGAEAGAEAEAEAEALNREPVGL